MPSGIVFCAPYPNCTPITLHLPFGLPQVAFTDPCCRGLDLSLDKLNNLLAPLMPFLQLIACVAKLVDIVLGIPASLGPPPSPSKIVKLVGKVSDFVTKCLPLIASFVPIPFIPSPFCALVRDICAIISALLTCLKRALVIHIGCDSDVLLLASSSDAALNAMGICLAGESSQLATDFVNKMLALNSPFTMINLLISLIPGLPQAIGSPPYPFGAVTSVSAPIDTSPLDIIITTLGIVQVIASICAGGGVS
jgi:hypothetical protein